MIETLEVGLCGTDLTINAGEYGTPPEGRDELVIGHEVLGRIRSGGGGFAAGDLVAATVRRPCGRCNNCAAGEVDACSTGNFLERGIVGLDGFASQLFVEEPTNLVLIPDSLGRLGVLAEPMSIAERGWRHARYVGRRQGWEPRRAFVLGVGAIGLLSVCVLRLAGIETWAFARRSSRSERAELLREVGAHYVSSEEATLSELAAEVGSPDAILEAAGSGELAVEAISALAINGVLCLRGIGSGTEAVPVPASLFVGETVLQNKSIIGSSNAAPRDWVSAVNDLVAVRERWPDVLEQVVGLAASPTEYRDALAYEGVKATIRFA